MRAATVWLVLLCWSTWSTAISGGGYCSFEWQCQDENADYSSTCSASEEACKECDPGAQWCEKKVVRCVAENSLLRGRVVHLFVFDTGP